MEIECPRCFARMKVETQITVQDLTCEWSESVMTDSRPLVASVVGGDLLVACTLPTGRPIFSAKLGQEVPLLGGHGTDVYRLEKIAPGVWKLRPSLVAGDIHAFVTIVGVPEPAPFE